MAKVPSVRILSFDSPSLDKSVGHPLNQFVKDVSSALSNGLTVTQNMAAQVNTLTFYLPASGVVPPLSFAWQFPQTPPKGCIIVAADAINLVRSLDPISTGLMPRWTYGGDGGLVRILNIRGTMTVDTRYSVTFHTFA